MILSAASSGDTVVRMLLSEPMKLALIWGLLALGLYLSFRILDVADLSLEGTFPVSGIITVLAINAGLNPWVSLLLAMAFGALMGLVTAALNVYLKIPFLLSGIIVMTALFSVNVLLGHGSVTIAESSNTVFGWLDDAFVSGLSGLGWGTPKYWGNFFGTALVLVLIDAAVAGMVYWFFGTEIGLAIRASGRNRETASASGINNRLSVLLCMSISGAVIALAGSLYAQDKITATNTAGQGTLVLSLAIVFIGELVLRGVSFKTHLASIFVGGFVYWLILGLIEKIPGFNVNFIYLIQAAMMTVVMVLGLLIKKLPKKGAKKEAVTHA
jgi:putative ABC transport system permease protein